MLETQRQTLRKRMLQDRSALLNPSLTLIQNKRARERESRKLGKEKEREGGRWRKQGK